MVLVIPYLAALQTIMTLAGYGMIAFTYNLVDEMMPIYASAPLVSGGLALSTSELAVPLAAGGSAIILWSLLGYPWLRSKLGTKNTCRSGLLCSAGTVILLALPSVLVPGQKAASIVSSSLCPSPSPPSEPRLDWRASVQLSDASTLLN